MFNTTQRFSWLSSMLAAVSLGLMTLLSGCGGGGTSPSQQQPMYVLPDAVTVYAYSSEPTRLTIRNGKKPFHVVSDNTAIISFNPATMVNGTVPDEYIDLGGPSGEFGRVNNVDVDTTVTLTVFDADNQQVKVAVTVKPSSLNDTLTVTDPLQAGAQGNVSVRATSITGAPLMGHKVRFRVMDQGAAYGFVCNQVLSDCIIIETDAQGRIITVETTTDRNGDAFAVTRADVGASTQYATIRATDMETGHELRKQFVIAGLALAVLPTSATWTITYEGDGDGIDNDAPPVGACIGAATSFYIYGGTPPYTITSTAPSIVTVGGAATTTVNTSGGTFVAQAACLASGQSTLVIVDAIGAILGNVTFSVNFTVTNP